MLIPQLEHDANKITALRYINEITGWKICAVTFLEDGVLYVRTMTYDNRYYADLIPFLVEKGIPIT